MNEEHDCPLCTQEMDYTDRHLKPCPCRFQICLWCWHRILQGDGRCPACRSSYNKEKIIASSEGNVERNRVAWNEKRNEKLDRKLAFQSPPVKDLRNARVVQKNLVRVVGLPHYFANEETLRQEKFFGQYGRLLKLSVSKSFGVFLKFEKVQDAEKCIKAVDGCIFEGEK